MTNPEVNHGKQPAVNPEVVVNGPLGETTVKIGGEQTAPTPDEPVEPAEPAEPEETEPEPEPAPDAEEPEA